MASLSAAALHAMSDDACQQALTERFDWLRGEERTVRELIKASHGTAEYSEDPFLRLHTPRIVASLQEVRDYVADDAQVLDVSCHPLISGILERNCGGAWKRTSFEPGSDIQLDCTADCWPLTSESWDMLVLMEVLEHIDRHPQHVFAEINRALKPGGRLFLTTPNITSWKKLLNLSDGDWDYDSPTFGGFQGHRYEYSWYQLATIAERSGFRVLSLKARDVYPHDPAGLAPLLQIGALAAAKTLCGRVRQAAKLWMRRGSVLFLVCEKAGEPRGELMPI